MHFDAPDRPRRLPDPVPESVPPGFPVLSAFAPALAAVGLWAATGNATTLWFAALGPVVALATMLDGRRQTRRRRRRATDARAAAIRDLEGQVEAFLVAEGGRRRVEAGSAREVLDGLAGPPWGSAGPPDVVIGSGPAPSGLRLEGDPVDDVDRALVAQAALLPASPVVVPLADGLGILGPAAIARSLARSVLVQAAYSGSPASIRFAGPGTAEWRMLDALPHAGRQEVRVVDRHAVVRSEAAVGPAGVIAIASEATALPPGLGTVVRLHSADSAWIERGGGAPRPFRPSLHSAAECTAWFAEFAARARDAGLAGAAELPASVPFGDPLLAASRAKVADRRDRAGLPAAVGIGRDGVLELDLVRGGPHAVVAGTSGSGKSVFLVAWVAAMAAARSPERVSFLLVDFKGGAAFAPVAELPHVVGVVTDLDDAGADRALTSLRAELARREALLAEAGVPEIGALGPHPVEDLARLVVVVDEYQSLLERHRELGALVGDLAARGRSLGVHVILATQRPLGVVRDSVLANCPIRVCLRVLAEADSTALVGVPDAAALPADRPGRAVVDAGDGRVVGVQTAIAGRADLAAIEAADARAPRPRRPWLDPLPALVDLAELPGLVAAGEAPAVRGIPVGLADEPSAQRRSIACWDADRDGALLVLGAAGSGRSTILGVLAAGAAARPVVSLGGPASAVSDVLDALDGVEAVSRGAGPLVLIDDLDRIADRWEPDARAELLERLGSLLRSAPSRGIAVAATAARLPGSFARLADEFGEVLRLRPIEAEAVGSRAQAAPPRDARPGLARWKGLDVQCARSAAACPPPPRPPVPTFVPGDGLVLVASSRPAATLRRWAAAHPGRPAAPLTTDPVPPEIGEGAAALIGDADAWAVHWSLAARCRDTATIVATGPAELRAITRAALRGPLLDPGGEQIWVLRPGGAIRREQWASAAESVA
ncbi:FtsK/SpoIIIE domain-containing protein [Agromyces seonyuensis]|uniref:FtsK domain-containing protein n=1 Tax=Agromyces seonyuensis TaxID=2662446 RepID=A0A6I4NX57_9MICO|nr:FtsK/SpoIIIE domain-containing protein [Agromyces seonyuensis]MWB98771.1 hypothetical protein [Agromyces seonyuensis]